MQDLGIRVYEVAYVDHPLYVLLYFGLGNGAVMCDVDRLVFMSVFKYIAYLLTYFSAYVCTIVYWCGYV